MQGKQRKFSYQFLPFMLDLKPAEVSGNPQSLHPKSLRGTKLPIKTSDSCFCLSLFNFFTEPKGRLEHQATGFTYRF